MSSPTFNWDDNQQGRLEQFFDARPDMDPWCLAIYESEQTEHVSQMSTTDQAWFCDTYGNSRDDTATDNA